MNNSFFSRLAPKESKFFPVLKKISDVIILTADLMIDSLHDDYHQTAMEYYKKIKEQEHYADTLSHQIFDDLNTTFITPFDREDIHDLANMLDDVIDGINNSAKRIALYMPKHIPESAITLAELIKEAAIFIGKAIDELDVLKRSSSKIKEYCNHLHEIENKADDVYEHFITKMFNEETDGIEIIKLKDIMYELEKTTDSAEYVGKIIKTIIVKYA
jgi:predicted phosphate transport protein (TIGR00153 family)